jgi:tetratricopeptide (TPR) repeat protein
LNEVDQAADSLKTAVTLDSEMSKAQYLLGRALVCRKDYVEAEKALRESIRINPDFAPAHEELRRALEGQGFKY